MDDIDTIKAIQGLLGVKQDGRFGAASRAALESLIAGATSPVAASDGVHTVKASSFADPADVRAFKRCKERGGSDHDCFKVGDNGIGAWGDDCSEGSGASCALPPDDMIAKWGSVEAAKHKLVDVKANEKSVTCVLKDRMPWKRHITNGAGIDLNPDSVRALGLEPPIMVSAQWSWT
jgi:hypothetical protein